MAIQIYNTLTKQKEAFIPLNGKKVNIYSCGVTVYDKCHIGHARSLYIFDVICRYLKHRDYDVHFVRNITDVDDKIINKAKELNKSFEEVVEENIALYKKDLESLGVNEADKEPRATENITGMIQDIEGLIAKGFAYEVNGNVYYSVRQFKT
ncbi:Cysteinyl-tRNA synthetase, partial [hydrothermal vent metagenome]